MKRIKIILDNKTQYDSCVKMLEMYFEFSNKTKVNEFPTAICLYLVINQFTNINYYNSLINDDFFDYICNFYEFKSAYYSVLNYPI